MLSPAARERFDALLEEVLAALPKTIRDLLHEAPLIVDDTPTPALLRELGIDPEDETLCGLHSGTPLTHRSVDFVPELPETIHIFRQGVLEQAGGWEEWVDENGEMAGGEHRVKDEIRVTLLHEIGHHFGLDEDDLTRLGYE